MNLQDIGATEIITVCILALAAVGFLKGLFRTVSALVCLGAAGYAALWGNEHAHDFTSSWSHAIPSIWVPKVVALLSGLVVFGVCRYLLNFLVDPFDESETGRKIGFGLPAAALSLVAGLALVWGSATAIRYAASLSELRDMQRTLSLKNNELTQHSSVLILKAQQALDASQIGQWQRQTDPFYTSGKLALSKLLIMYYDEPTRSQMLRNQELSTFLNHPEFIKLAYCAELKHYPESGKPREIFNAQAVNQALQQPDFRQRFNKIDLEALGSTYAQLSP